MARFTKAAIKEALANLEDDERELLAAELGVKKDGGDTDLLARIEELGREVAELKKSRGKKPAGGLLDFLKGL